MELDGRIALITGSTRGIGAETARLFAAEGADVIISGRDAEHGENVAEEIRGAGGRARFIAADLIDLGSLRGLAEAAGPVDVLVNNAALFPMAPMVDQDADSFDRALAANVRAPFFLTAALVPGMITRGSGSIVNVSTMAASVAMPGLSLYSASKAALESLTRTWAAEFASAGVRVNAVAPGPTLTEMTAAMGDAIQSIADTTLLRRVASTAEIAQAILFLASDRSSYMTGATLAADGGRTAA